MTEPVSKEESDQTVQEFEDNVAKSLEHTQTEMESRLIKQHLKWILPWFQMMKATELLQHSQIHGVSFCNTLPFILPLS